MPRNCQIKPLLLRRQEISLWLDFPFEVIKKNRKAIKREIVKVRTSKNVIKRNNGNAYIRFYPKISSVVRGRGLEPPSPYGRYHLKVVRLPVSPPAQDTTKILNHPKKFVQCYLNRHNSYCAVPARIVVRGTMGGR